MAKRYGRNQKRAHRAEIAALKAKLYGIWGEPPERLTRIDNIPRASMDVRQSEDRGRIEEDVSIRVILQHGDDIDTLYERHANYETVVLGDKCLVPTGMARPSLTERIEPWIELDLEYKRVIAPKEL